MAFNPEGLRGFIKNGSQTFRENSVSYILYCPHCGKEKLYIRKKDGVFKCWVCAETQNFKGNAEFALFALYGGKLEEYRMVLRGEVGNDMRQLDILLADHWGEEETELEVEPQLTDWEWHPLSVDCHEKAFEPGRKYLNGRGLSDAVIEKYNIHYIASENRVQFPFIVDGKLVGWQGRFCGPTEIKDPISGYVRRIPKAMTTIQEGVQGRHFMFGDSLKGSQHAILCEGPMDALKADLCGGNVASLGKAVTQRQLEYLGAKVKRLYVALDPDAADEMARLVRNKALGLEVYILAPPPGCKDLGDAEPGAVLEVFRTARPFYRGQIIVNLKGMLCF